MMPFTHTCGLHRSLGRRTEAHRDTRNRTNLGQHLHLTLSPCTKIGMD